MPKGMKVMDIDVKSTRTKYGSKDLDRIFKMASNNEKKKNKFSNIF